MPEMERLLIPVTIANGATESAVVDVRGPARSKDSGLLVGIEMPAAFTGTSIRFDAATSAAGTYQRVYTDGGVEINFTVAQGRYVVILAPIDLAALMHFKLIVDAQGAARTLNLVVLRS